MEDVIEFADRDEYVKWRAEWRKRYRQLATDIRKLKTQRKMFVAVRESKEIVKRFPNPRYDVEAPYLLWPMRMEAAEMMHVRQSCRDDYNKRRQEQLAGAGRSEL